MSSTAVSHKVVRKVVANQPLPEVDFSVSTQGVTIYSDRFFEPRFLEFDIKGKCPKCKSNSTDIDYFINANGIEIESTRFNQARFVFFDIPHHLPNQCHFRVRMKGQNYLIPFENSGVSNTTDNNNIEVEETTIDIGTENLTKEKEGGKTEPVITTTMETTPISDSQQSIPAIIAETIMETGAGVIDSIMDKGAMETGSELASTAIEELFGTAASALSTTIDNIRKETSSKQQQQQQVHDPENEIETDEPL